MRDLRELYAQFIMLLQERENKVITTDHVTDKEFISVAFSQQNDKEHLVTLTGGQDG